MNDKYEKLRKKVEKANPDYLTFIDSATKEDLVKEFDRCSKYMHEIELAMEKDEELNKAKELVKELKSQYNDSKRPLSERIKLVVYAIEEKWGFSSEG
jgi:DNA-binding transcriptional regulator GbsR (MarR family)